MELGKEQPVGLPREALNQLNKHSNIQLLMDEDILHKQASLCRQKTFISCDFLRLPLDHLQNKVLVVFQE